MMIGIEDVAAKVMNEPRDTGDYAFPILTVDEENNRLFLLCRHVDR